MKGQTHTQQQEIAVLNQNLDKAMVIRDTQAVYELIFKLDRLNTTKNKQSLKTA